MLRSLGVTVTQHERFLPGVAGSGREVRFAVIGFDDDVVLGFADDVVPGLELAVTLVPVGRVPFGGGRIAAIGGAG